MYLETTKIFWYIHDREVLKTIIIIYHITKLPGSNFSISEFIPIMKRIQDTWGKEKFPLPIKITLETWIKYRKLETRKKEDVKRELNV